MSLLANGMTDVFTPRKRSDIMSRVKSRGNRATELRLVQILRSYRIRGWRRNLSVFGSPDFVFRRPRLAVFVDGCFWHGCPLHGSIPSTNYEFWKAKLAKNKARDRLVNRRLQALGWRIVRLWQHELSEPSKVATRILRKLSFDS